MAKPRERVVGPDVDDPEILFTMVTVELSSSDHSCSPDCHCWKEDMPGTAKTSNQGVTLPPDRVVELKPAIRMVSRIST
jgi:hypothetical protein